MASISIPFYLCLLAICAKFAPQLAYDMPRPIFFLGDSTADVGTNNLLHGSKLTANFLPNGVDFPRSQPTGRFSNGFNTADELAKLFGLKRSPPPYLFLLTLGSHQFKRRVLRGANFASGGAGILDKTNSDKTVMPLSEQINQFTSLHGNFTAMMGAPKTEAMLNKSLFFISIGSNDILNYSPREDGTGDAFISLLIATYSKHITTLYEMGARRFGIISIPPVGCCPHSRLKQFKKNGSTSCDSTMNDLARAFHSALNTLLLHISSKLLGMKYSLGNTYQMTYDIINRKSFGFHDVESACCGHGNLNAQGPCNSTALSCPDRLKYLFWDMYHPTQVASTMEAVALYLGPFYVSPISFGQLAGDN
ncbi:GDSL esterase/lipase At5g55050-like [Salvia miltiorrhiza]|uniref:GDSL esterase/lipase At5g55050-like n=1 Tax=Salvia miltiorrhiza TaxID=226208 RepID=UPI0025AC3526|nr:GDSL esterase/lipase At5g55050-like [Salvia miltiorrhiza]